MTNQAAQTPTPAERGLPIVDDFNGDNAHLIESAKALISLSDSGSLVPHGIGGHARGILSAFIVRMESARPLPSDWVAVPDLGTLCGVLWRDDLTNQQIDEMARSLHKWLHAWNESRAPVKAAPSAPAEAVQTAPEPLAQGECVGVWSGNAAARGEPGGPVKWATGLTYSSLPDGTKLYASPQPAAEGGSVSHVTIDFPQIGTAGPFKVIDGRMTLPDVTMNDLMHHARMGYVPKPNPPQPSASVGETARELLAAKYDAEGWITEANACRRGISGAVDRFALRAIESALTQQDTSAAEHWHGLYRKECRLRQDDAARYGQQIVDLESALTTAAAGGGEVGNG